MDYKKNERTIPVCLECGDRIRYGRADKKFCCDDCRTRHYNEKAKVSRSFRRRVLKSLSRNYEILDHLIRADVDSVDLITMAAMGFSPALVTSYRKAGRHEEFGCFDIRYIMTGSRVYSISKMENFD